jgi:hypothetical protein
VTSEHSPDSRSPISDRDSNDFTRLPSLEILRRYDDFLSDLHKYRRYRLEALSRREKFLTYAFIVTSAATIITGAVTLVYLVTIQRQYAVVIPLTTICLAALASFFKQLQVQAQKRINNIVRDIRTEEKIRGATAAVVSSKGTAAEPQMIQSLFSALMTLKADQEASEQPPLHNEGSTSPRTSEDSWDPISTFLNIA